MKSSVRCSSILAIFSAGGAPPVELPVKGRRGGAHSNINNAQCIKIVYNKILFSSIKKNTNNNLNFEDR